MSQPPLPAVCTQAASALLPVAIDYPAALALRQMAMQHDDYPKYLLAPEVSALLHYVPDLHRRMLLATLWNTGARINEALALTRETFRWHHLSVCAAGHSETAGGKGGQNGRTDAVRQPAAWCRFLITSMSANCR